tara:strand:+ start:134 stop:304 length:171 start_codon:yes stop_codon:yes gene_type:complete
MSNQSTWTEERSSAGSRSAVPSVGGYAHHDQRRASRKTIKMGLPVDILSEKRETQV